MGLFCYPLSSTWLFHSFFKPAHLQSTQKSTECRNVPGAVPRNRIVRSNNYCTTERCQKEWWIFLAWPCCVSNKTWFNYGKDSANLTLIELSFILGMILSAITLVPYLVETSYSRSKQGCGNQWSIPYTFYWFWTYVKKKGVALQGWNVSLEKINKFLQVMSTGSKLHSQYWLIQQNMHNFNKVAN